MSSGGPRGSGVPVLCAKARKMSAEEQRNRRRYEAGRRGVHSVTTYKGQREFETRVSLNFPINLTSLVPKLSQISFKLSDVSNLIPNGYGKK